MRLSILLITCLLLGLIIVSQSPHAFAASYDSMWYIFQEGDQQKRHFAEIQVTYSSSDTARAGKTFPVNVSLTYLKNEKSYITSIDFYAVTVHVRKALTGSDFASDMDNSKMTLKTGDRYAQIHPHSTHRPW
jgi:hypothetical protein